MSSPPGSPPVAQAADVLSPAGDVGGAEGGDGGGEGGSEVEVGAPEQSRPAVADGGYATYAPGVETGELGAAAAAAAVDLPDGQTAAQSSAPKSTLLGAGEWACPACGNLNYNQRQFCNLRRCG